MRLFIDNNEHKWGLMLSDVGNEIVKYYESVKKEKFESSRANFFFWQFINKIRNNKYLILLAQREYINSTFTDYNQMDEIEDTNVPWDWDHIYPSEWVYRTRCNQAIKDWNNTNGNLRTISLEDNRRRGNKQSPHDITNEEERKYSFIKDNDWKYWKNIDNRIWGNEIQNHFRAITIRMINIYKRFWDDFKLQELIIEYKKEEQLQTQLDEKILQPF